MCKLAHASRSRLCSEQRPFKRDEEGSFIVDAKASGAAVGGIDAASFGGECDMDDEGRQQHPALNCDCDRDLRHRDSAIVGGEERLVESLGAVAINKRRKTGP